VGDATERPEWNLLINAAGGKLSVVFETTLGAKSTRATIASATLVGARLRGQFDGTLPAGVPAQLDARFVDKYPPSNAKGPVVRGILIGKRFYSRPDP
jgi:hypothetical protein